MTKQMLMTVLMAAWLVMIAACVPPSTVVQLNTPAPNAPATPAPGGQIDVPGLKIQLYIPGPNPQVNTPAAHGRPASFWMGVWHGIISPFTLAASFLGRANVQMYEVRNDGRLYNLGFFFGVLIMPAVLGIFFGSRR